MFKRLISFLAVFILLFTATVPVMAAEPDQDMGIMTTDELYDLETLGTVEFPSWSFFNEIYSTLPTTHSTSAGETYNIDRYYVYLANSGVYDDDTYHINVALWDSSITTVKSYNTSSYTRLYCYDNNSLDRVNIAVYWWDKTTNTWVWSSSTKSDDYVSTYTARGLYSNERIFTRSDDTLVGVSKGVQPYYDSFLITSGDPDYSSGDTTGGNNTGGSFTQAEKKSLFTWLEKIWTAINTLASSIGSYFSDLGNHLGQKLDDIYNALVENTDGETTGRNLWDAIASIGKSIEGIVDDITDSIEGVVEDITTAIEGVVEDITGAIKSAVTDITDTISDLGDDVVEIFNVVSNFFLTFFDKLYEKLEQLLTFLFIPKDGYFEDVLGRVNGKVDGTGKANTGSILTTVKAFATELRDFLEGDFNTPPKVEINLGAAEGKYNYGTGTVNAIDFSWFARYRKLTDPFLSAILWIGFMWLLVKRLPDILSAVGMTTDGGLQAVDSYHTARALELEKANRQEERAQKEAKRERDAEHRKSYEYYKENRSRKETYSARYNREKRGGR